MLHIGTRKGLFTAEKSNGRWKIVRSSFLGVQVPMLLPDLRDGTLYAAVDHGHFGTKFHRSPDLGSSWEELTAPAYPPRRARLLGRQDTGGAEHVVAHR